MPVGRSGSLPPRHRFMNMPGFKKNSSSHATATTRPCVEASLDRPAPITKRPRGRLRALRNDFFLHSAFWITHTPTRHACLPPRGCLNSATRTTQRSWQHETGRCKKVQAKPKQNLHGSCFKFAEVSPFHHTPDRYVRCAQTNPNTDRQLHVWGFHSCL